MPTSNDHNAHDQALIAAHAAGDLAGPRVILADRLLASCDECRHLHTDLRAIAAAARALPPLAAAPRDYRLTADQAARLRRGSFLRRLLRPLAEPSWSLRPLATTFSGLGAIGLAVVLLLPLLGGTAASLSVGRSGSTAIDAGASPAPVPAAGEGAASSPGAIDYFGPNAATAAPGEQPADQDKTDDGTQGGTEPPAAANAGSPVNPATVLLVGSIALLALGLALFALRTLARRIA